MKHLNTAKDIAYGIKTQEDILLRGNVSEKRKTRARKKLQEARSVKKMGVTFIFDETYPIKESLKNEGWHFWGQDKLWWSHTEENLDPFGKRIIKG
jgi:hypothetical protein